MAYLVRQKIPAARSGLIGPAYHIRCRLSSSRLLAGERGRGSGDHGGNLAGAQRAAAVVHGQPEHGLAAAGGAMPFSFFDASTLLALALVASESSGSSLPHRRSVADTSP